MCARRRHVGLTCDPRCQHPRRRRARQSRDRYSGDRMIRRRSTVAWNQKTNQEEKGELKVDTRLTESEERWLKGKLVDDGVQNQASNNLLRVRPVRGWGGVSHIQATDCLQTTRNR